MPVEKLSTGGSFDGVKSEEGNDSLNNFIRQSIRTEPLFPLIKTGDNPMPWIQLLHALDQPDLLGWPLTTPLKVQMQKCKKCSQEFCSPINYRRHFRVHRRSLNVNKEFYKNRDLLAAFWDKLSLEEAKEVVSFKDVMLKESTGPSLITALASSLCKPDVWTLPQVYVRAGSSLLDIIQAKPSRLPISSQQLFGILDAASERTFLCAGAPEAVQKYIFDREAAIASLELNNLVASISFLFEQQLVKAWVVDKDAEALRCQKLLVEEEEAAKKRLAEILERKKQKKLRQKEHKLKEHFHQCEGDLISVANDAADRQILGEAIGPPSPSDSTSNSIDGSLDLDTHSELQNQNPEKDIEAQIDFSSDCSQEDSQNMESQMVDQHWVTNTCPVQNSQKMCPSPIEDRAPVNCSIKKDEPDSLVECLKPSFLGGISFENNFEVIIGSISIPVTSCGTVRKLHSHGEVKGIAAAGGGVNGLQRIAPFSCTTARDFLARRWNEAISKDHVQLVLS